MNKTILKNALLNAGLTTGYIILIVLFISNMEKTFGANKPDTNILVPITMLLLFVVSAAITGWLVLGKPSMWYLDGKKKEAVSLLGYTLGFMAIILIILFSII